MKKIIKTPQYQCQSIWNGETNQVEDCTCGKCAESIKRPLTNQEPVERDWIETWKLDLERLLWSYHENGRPDGKTGVIDNPKTIQEFVEKLISQAKLK